MVSVLNKFASVCLRIINQSIVQIENQ